jgi:hypothetical protein
MRMIELWKQNVRREVKKSHKRSYEMSGSERKRRVWYRRAITKRLELVQPPANPLLDTQGKGQGEFSQVRVLITGK